MAVVDHGNGLYELGAQGDAMSGTFYIDWVEWVSKGGATGGDLLLDDTDGNTIKQGVASGANYFEHYPVEGVYIDPTATTMDNGVLFVKTKSHPDNI
jgi:hypothetical protein